MAALLLLVGGAGCERRFSCSEGLVSSSGGRLGTWGSTPQECMRGGYAGVGANNLQSVVTLLWEDPKQRNENYRDHKFETSPDLPQRLYLVQDDRDNRGLVAVIETLKTKGTQMDGGNCRTLRLDTHEEGRVMPEGRPTLAGRVEMDCSVDGDHVTADVSFKRCEW